jgi:hypothetical protein
MSATFSINIGQVVETEKKSSVFDVLSKLPDNTQKLIKPRDVRDAFFSSWAGSTFKVTTPSNSGIEYIGIDSSNPDDRDIKKKILLGKRSYGNLDILNDSLINDNTSDIFIYNTKLDSVTQSSTKIAILAGTSSAYFDKAPYIESIANTSSVIDLNLINPATSGVINVIAQSGRVAINGILFPSLEQTASASNGKILRYYGTYPQGSLRWDDTNVTLSSIGIPGSTTSIIGDDVLINGYPMEFIEDSLVPTSVGGVPQGFSFSSNSFNSQDWPLVEVLRKILYPYKEPELSLSSDVEYVEVGATTSITLDFSLKHYARNSSEFISEGLITGTTYSNGGIKLYGLPGSSLTGSTITSTFSGSTGSVNYTFAVSNSGGSASLYPYSSFSYSATASIEFIPPVVGCFVSENLVNFSMNDPVTRKLGSEIIVSGITVSNYKVIDKVTGLTQSFFINASGGGYLYFYYPSTVANVRLIKDPNGFIIHDSSSLTYSSFTYSTTISLNKVNSGTLVNPIPYILYRTIATCSYIGDANFEFIF